MASGTTRGPTHLNFDSHTFDPRPRYPLVATAKRYWHPDFYSEDADALTLIFAHGTGFHKEHWEPTLEYVYETLARTGGVKLREAWSIDCPNHGDAAVINEEELQWGYEDLFAWEEYARSLHDFLTGQGTGIPVDFSTRRLVGIGHSMGALSLMLAGMHQPKLTFSALILVDPMIFFKPPSREDAAMTVDLAGGAAKRRDIWASREEAFKSLQSRPSFKVWDPRILEIFVEHGLRELPTADYPDKTVGVTLKCPRSQEAACYRDGLGYSRGYKLLKYLCQIVPVHFIYGAVDDYLPGFVKEDVLENACDGKYASVARVPDAGHLVPQMQPRGLADAIFVILELESNRLSTPLQQQQPYQSRL